MYSRDLPDPPSSDLNAEQALAAALDTSNPDAERVHALHLVRSARGQETRSALARRLVPLLNVQRLWLGNEAHACIRSLDPNLLVGLEEAGPEGVQLCASSPDGLTRDAIGDAFSPTLGLVVPIGSCHRLIPRLPPLPWLACLRGTMSGLLRRAGASVGRVEIDATQAHAGFSHVRFAMREGQLLVTGPEPVVINDQVVDAPALLGVGDVVQAGQYEIVVEIIGPYAAGSAFRIEVAGQARDAWIGEPLILAPLSPGAGAYACVVDEGVGIVAPGRRTRWLSAPGRHEVEDVGVVAIH